jgi:hypothetical protein
VILFACWDNIGRLDAADARPSFDGRIRVVDLEGVPATLEALTTVVFSLDVVETLSGFECEVAPTRDIGFDATGNKDFDVEADLFADSFLTNGRSFILVSAPLISFGAGPNNFEFAASIISCTSIFAALRCVLI